MLPAASRQGEKPAASQYQTRQSCTHNRPWYGHGCCGERGCGCSVPAALRCQGEYTRRIVKTGHCQRANRNDGEVVKISGRLCVFEEAERLIVNVKPLFPVYKSPANVE